MNNRVVMLEPMSWSSIPASALEGKAEKLCSTLKKVDYAEQQLQKIKQLQTNIFKLLLQIKNG